VSKLNFFTKISYGVGQVGEGIKNTAFEAFLFFYYNQGLGLSATLAGSATLLALVVDAFFDPALGSVSDSVRTRLGRRHPFMYAGAVPFGLMFYLLFSPPAWLQPAAQHQMGLFLWLTGFAIAVRAAMAVYLIPHNALGAELSADYHERTSIGSWRISLGLIAGFATLLVGYGYFFKDASQQDLGLKRIAAYPAFAAFFAVIATGAVLWSALGTHSRIRHLVQPTSTPERFSYKRLYIELKESLRSPSFRALFVGTLVFFVTRGVQTTLANHMSVHFWELSSNDIVTVNIFAFSGLMVGIPFWSIASRRLDKRPTFLVGVLIFSVFVVLGPVMKLAGIWPPRAEEHFYLGLLGGFGFLASFGAAAALISATSMMADLTDEHEYDTGRRQEGIFFGALAFSGKASSGLGHGIAGVALDLIGFPTQADRGSVPPDVVHHLGMLYGPGTILILILGVVYFARYQLTAARVAEMQKVLEQRRTLSVDR
jgi:GPH family glycoside/pentoside/hexuronide:cation symporter